MILIVKLLEWHTQGRFALYIFFLGNLADMRRPWAIADLSLLWSLAIEEHFYLFFPFAVRFLSKRTLLIGLIAVILIEPFARLMATSHFSTYGPIYFFTLFRLDGLALGALLSLALESDRARAALAKWSGLAMLCLWGLYIGLSASMPLEFARDRNTHLFNSVGYSLVALMSVALIAFVLLNPESLLSKALELKYVVFIGTISYGVYLSHYPIMRAAVRLTGFPAPAVLPITICATLLVSWFSFKFFEKPIIDWGHDLARSPRIDLLFQRRDIPERTV